MATRVQDILLRARDTLADPLKERWTDERLLRLLDEGQKVIATEANYLRETLQVDLVEGSAEYRLPETTITLLQVVSRDISLPLLSHEEAARQFGKFWRTHVGYPKAIVFDRLKLGTIRAYPVPDAASAISVESIASFGVLSAITSTSPLTLSSPYGLTTGFTGATVGSLTVSISRLPTMITTTTDLLEIAPVFDRALKLFITGNALRDDKDTQNRQIGLDELTYFGTELRIAIKDSARDGIRQTPVLSAKYQGAF